MFYKEWDIASYRLRFCSTWSVFKFRDNTEKLKYVLDIDSDNGWLLSDGDQGEWYEWSVVAPKYHPIDSGFYKGVKSENTFCAVKRHLNKSFKVGLSPESYDYHWFNNPFGYKDTPNVLNPVEVNVDKALYEGIGPLSKRLMLSKESIYYLTTVIGFRSGMTFVVDPMFKSEMEDCLRGHECLIKL